MIIKKIISAVASVSVLSALGIQTSSALNYSLDDAFHIRDAILKLADVTDSDDINGDGIVNVFDLCEVKKAIMNSGEFIETNYSATEENVKLVGRTLYSDDTAWLVQSGSAIEFTVTGKYASITLAGDSSINNGEDYRSRYAVLVDGEIIEDDVMSEKEKTVSLFDGETSRTAKVKVIHLSEAMNGAIGVKNISVTSNISVPVYPEPAKDISIEFIGDSITCAYGVEGLSSSEPFKTTTENFMKSYAYLTAQQLDADYSAVSYSGHGIISGYTSSGDINTESIIPDCYGLVGKSSEYAESWDFSKTSYDVVVINLGTNDSTYVTKDSENRSLEFIDGYVDFLKTVRAKNPNAYIICTLGTMGDELYEYVEKAVEQYSTSENDDRITSYKSAVHNISADGVGSDWHPSAITQQKSAYVLADKICQVLGMESDQIGLDMTADSEYTLDIDADKGGNAAYYVGYDKSFWINMVTGGETADAIEAVIPDINLKEGGGYRLEFDCTSSFDGKLPVQIKGSDGKIYFSDEFDAVSEKTHFSAEFTSDITDESASIIFQLGGKDYYNITFSNISLIKIS